MTSTDDKERSADSEGETGLEETLPVQLPADPSPPDDPNEPLGRGSSVGRYTVLDRIGAGGMGVVYAAFDPQLDRRIALKVMHPGNQGTLGSGGRTRLLREAQAMAKLSHPNVITVHDVGTYGDRVFVAMEFIEGMTLRDWVGAERTWQEIVEAFVRAGRGLAAAHAVGLVHRDFKPDNVLMGNDGRVLVMDFGLARQASTRTNPLEESAGDRLASAPHGDLGLTRTGAVLGTPAYMAPEQHKAVAIGPNSDQFSFCVALYEGLYGERPFGGNSVASLAMNVLEGRVKTAPRDARVPPWLRDAIVRGLALDPDDRYPSMDALLAELQRDPPHARRPWLTAAAGIAVVGVVGGAYYFTRPPDDAACRDAESRLSQDWNEERRQKIEVALLATDVSYADATWQTVGSGLDDYAERWLSAYAARCAADQGARRRDANRPQDIGLLCLDDRRRDLSALAEALADENDASVAIMSAAAATQSLAAPETCTSLEGGSDPRQTAAPKERSRLGEIQHELSRTRALLTTGQPEPALAAAQSVVAKAGSIDATGVQAEALVLVAEAQLVAGQPGPGERSLRQAILAAAKGQRGDVEARAWTMMVEVVALRQGLYDAGRRVALGAEAAIARAGDDPELRGRLLMGLGEIAQAEGRFDEAVDHFERALTIRRDHLPPDDLRVATARTGVGRALEGLDRFAEASRQHNGALAVREQVLGAQHPMVAESLIRFGSAMHGQQRNDLASASLLRARMLLDPRANFDVGHLPAPTGAPPTEPDGAEAPEHPVALALCLDQLGILRRAQEDFADAARLHAGAAALMERHGGAEGRDIGYALENLGLALADLGRHADAIPHLQRALEVWKKSLVAGHPDVGIAHLNLANSLWADGNLPGAKEHYGHALNAWEDVLAEDHPMLAYALTGLGRTHLDLGEAATALELLTRASELRNHEDEDRLNIAETTLLLARAMWMSGRDSQRAIELAIVARETVGSPAPTDHTGLRRLLSGEHVPGFTNQLVPAGLTVNNLQ